MSYSEVQGMTVKELQMVLRHSSIYNEVYHYAMIRLAELDRQREEAERANFQRAYVQSLLISL